MAFFAKLESNVVVDVVVVNNSDMEDNSGVPSEAIGIGFLTKTYGAATNWKQSPKGNAAGIGMTYMEGVTTLGVGVTDIFIEVKPHDSWVIGINTANWFPPADPGPAPGLTTAQASAGTHYVWNETNYKSDPATAWVLTTL